MISHSHNYFFNVGIGEGYDHESTWVLGFPIQKRIVLDRVLTILSKN